MNKMTFIRQEYKNKDEMWNDIRDFMRMLMKNHQVCVIYDEGVVVVVEYEHNESIEVFGCERPVWLSSDECELVEDYRYNK